MLARALDVRASEEKEIRMKLWFDRALAIGLLTPIAAVCGGGCSDASVGRESLGADGVAETALALTTEVTSPLDTAGARATALVGRLSLAEKTGQMIQAELLNLKEAGFDKVRAHNLGSVLSGGNSLIEDNTPNGWQRVHDELQGYARRSTSAIPLLYAIDAVHGNAGVRGATVFPHNLALGATFDGDLVERVAQATAEEVAATGIEWTFAPSVSVVRDIRWGRTYESFGETPELQALLAAPSVRGLQGADLQDGHVVGTAKHFLGDGGTRWGTGMPRIVLPGWKETDELQLDRGDAQLDLTTLKALHGEGYRRAVRAGVATVMASFNSVNGTKMSAYGDLLTGYLKAPEASGGLGFQGFVISDWNSVTYIPVEGVRGKRRVYKEQIIRAVAAGLDMLMIEGKLDGAYRFELAHDALQEAVREGRLPMARIDDAVRRILTVKLRAGLFERVQADGSASAQEQATRKRLTATFGGEDHRAVAREAVRKSLVLLKNEGRALPLDGRAVETICVAGKNADNVGGQAGAWTIGWQGHDGNALRAPGDRTILDGIRVHAERRGITVRFAEDGQFGPECESKRAVAIVVLGERPYAEFLGDAKDLQLDRTDRATLRNVYSLGTKVISVLVSGRPLIITSHLPRWDAAVAAWLPGSQGEAVADVLFGVHDFQGKLPVTWPETTSQIPIHAGDRERPLFPYGFGLTYGPDEVR